MSKPRLLDSATYLDLSSLSGTSVHFPTADNGLVEITNIQGKYSQAVTVQGKQLFDKAKITAVKYIQPATGVVTNSSFNNNVSPLIPVTAGQSYTISGHTYVQPNTPVGIAWYNASGVYISGTSYQLATGNGTYTAPAGAAYVRYTINNVDLNTSQLESGSTATPYASYIPNSPSPDYPSVIHNVGDVPFNAIACGKNILPKSTIGTLSSNGITAVSNADGSITLNGTATSVANITILGTYGSTTLLSKIFKNINYTLKGTGNSGITIYLGYASDSAFVNTIASDKTFNLTDDKIISRVSLSIASGTVVNNLVIYPQIELGSASTPYDPYKGNQTPVTLQYGALPDGTRDEFVSDGTTAKDIKRKGRVILNGTESFSLNGASRFSGNYVGFDYAGINTTMLTGYNVNGLLCTHFEQLASGSNYQKPGIMKPNTSGGIVFGINKSLLTGWDDGLSNTAKANLFKAWLTAQYTANTPVMLDYPLATPTESPRDRIFTTSYSGTTNVYTTDPLQPTFTAVAKSELWSDIYDLNKDVSSKANKTQPSLNTPTFTNAWVTDGLFGYFLNPFGKLEFVGAIKTGTLGSSAFTLPAGYRPVTQKRVSCVSNGTFGYVIIGTDGTIKPYGNNTYISLDNISVRIDI
jgi:hypothetical protein